MAGTGRAGSATAATAASCRFTKSKPVLLPTRRDATKSLLHFFRSSHRRPQAANARTGSLYQPGIGPHPETQAVALVVAELAALAPARYQGQLFVGVPYPVGQQRCDLCVGSNPNWSWAVEIKMLRLMGDNGKPNDNMLMHILSPYPRDRSALTDCLKLTRSGLPGRKAVVIYGFDYPNLPMDPAIEAFEALAGRWVNLGIRCISEYSELVHPIHTAGRVFGWEVEARE